MSRLLSSPTTTLFSLLLLAATLVGCGMGKRNYEEAVSNPVREFPLEVRLAKVEKLGSDYRYAFQVTNTGQQAFEGPVDFDLINQALTVYTTSTRMGFAVGPGQTVLVNIDTPSEPHSVDPDGYRHWVFRAYSHQEHLLVRTHGDVPALSQ